MWDDFQMSKDSMGSVRHRNLQKTSTGGHGHTHVCDICALTSIRMSLQSPKIVTRVQAKYDIIWL